MTKLQFNYLRQNNYGVAYWDTTNSNFTAPYDGWFAFRLDAVFTYSGGAGSGLHLYLYKNNSQISGKGSATLGGSALRTAVMFVWYATKGDVYDIRVYSGQAQNMMYAYGGNDNNQDSALYIWNI